MSKLPPLHSVDPQEWLVYRDLMEDGGEVSQERLDFILKVAKALEEPKALALWSVSEIWASGMGGAVRWDNLLLPGNYYPAFMRSGKEEWREAKPDRNGDVFAVTPASYPGLPEATKWAFFERQAEGLP
jgi:hypothetical protein